MLARRKDMKTDYTLPTYYAARFNCPHCGAFADQKWTALFASQTVFPIWGPVDGAPEGIEAEPGESHGLWRPEYQIGRIPADISVCQSCYKFALWIPQTEKMVFPRIVTAPLPSPDMPEETHEFFEEARLVIGDSPRAAAALLRLALEKLMEAQEVLGDTLNQQIGNLVKERKLPLSVQKSLDAVRVIGNDAIHDLGQIQLDDDTETAGMLFGLVNFAVEKLITDGETVNEIYEMLPESKRKAIEERDSRADSN